MFLWLQVAALPRALAPPQWPASPPPLALMVLLACRRRRRTGSRRQKLSSPTGSTITRVGLIVFGAAIKKSQKRLIFFRSICCAWR